MTVDLRNLRELIQTAPAVELPGVIGELEQLKATAWSRLATPAPAPTPPADVANLAAEDLARLFNVPKSLFYELARRGDLPHRRLGHYVRFSRDEVESWMAANSKTAGLGSRKKRKRTEGLPVPATALLPSGEPTGGLA